MSRPVATAHSCRTALADPCSTTCLRCRTGHSALVGEPTDANRILRAIWHELDPRIRADFTREMMAWTRERDRVHQAIRLVRMRNTLGLKSLAVSVHLEVHLVGDPDVSVWLPGDLRGYSRNQYEIGGFSFAYGHDPTLIAEKLKPLCDRMPIWHDYLDVIDTQDDFLEALTRSGRVLGPVDLDASSRAVLSWLVRRSGNGRDGPVDISVSRSNTAASMARNG